jgi:hypothetical protein
MPSLPSHRRNISAGGSAPAGGDTPTSLITFEETRKTLIAINQSLFEETKMTLLELNQSLLNSIVDLNYDAYDFSCSNDISCIEPETNRNVVIGKEFHKYYFDVFGSINTDNEEGGNGMTKTTSTKVTMVKPHVQIMCEGNAAVISYVKLTQQTLPGKPPVTMQESETRVWEKRCNKWVNIHFHKSDYKS